MELFTTLADLRRWRADRTGVVGLVPTMGYLHRGHASLAAMARRENDHVIATVFVNPAQFGPNEDLARYPRDLAADRVLLDQEGCDVLFAPDAREVYPDGFGTLVDVGPVSGPLEGERRPGHFRGVATVVLKLFNMTLPHRAYFGQKDAQQLAVIRRMVRDLDVPVEVRACPTVREADGLALSSRNSYLDADARAAAPVLHRALSTAQHAWRNGERNGDAIRARMREVLAAEPLARADYVSVADPLTFAELETVTPGALVSMAVFVGRARLIDNVVLD